MHKSVIGDFIRYMQKHHHKLWFASINENRELVSFKSHQLESLFEDIKAVYSNREETKSLSIIKPGLEVGEGVVRQQKKDVFKKGHPLLTNACNTCYQTLNHEFFRIQTPVMPFLYQSEF